MQLSLTVSFGRIISFSFSFVLKCRCSELRVRIEPITSRCAPLDKALIEAAVYPNSHFTRSNNQGDGILSLKLVNCSFGLDGEMARGLEDDTKGF